MSVSKSMQLVNKSIDSMVSAIELYNKPDFRYREEMFCIAAVNSWELLVKAKMLKDNKNNMRSIYVREYLQNKDGTKSKKWHYKDNRAGNKMTIDIFVAMKRLKNKGAIDQVCFDNIEAIVEMRDNAVHYYNADSMLSQKVQELGTATIRNYIDLIRQWFSVRLDKYNFFLMPMSFFHSDRVEPIFLGNRDSAIANLLAYVAEKEARHSSEPEDKHNITIAIETKFTKATEINAQGIRISSDPNAPTVQISIDDIKKTHPIDYAQLTRKLNDRYTDFKVNQAYHELRRTLEKSQEYCFLYPQNPMKPDGAKKALYSPKVFEEFDKNYTKEIAQ